MWSIALISGPPIVFNQRRSSLASIKQLHCPIFKPCPAMVHHGRVEERHWLGREQTACSHAVHNQSSYLHLILHRDTDMARYHGQACTALIPSPARAYSELQFSCHLYVYPEQSLVNVNLWCVNSLSADVRRSMNSTIVAMSKHELLLMDKSEKDLLQNVWWSAREGQLNIYKNK